MIVIGNPNVLCKNKHWKSLWEYCENQGGCIPFERCPLKPNMIERLKHDQVNCDSAKKLSVTVEYGEEIKNSEKLSDVLVRKMDSMTL